MGKYDLALEEARRELERQSSDIASLRDRAVTLLTIGGTLATILGGLATRGGAEVRPFTYAGVGLFCALAVVAVVVMTPRKVHFGQDPAKIIEAADVQGSSSDSLVRHMAEQMNEQYETNKPKVDQLTYWYTGAVVLFAAEVVALLLDLRGR
ncbi:hypothetical protein [Nocardioides sp. LML1-1-1.1]|uniref:hypothetical protein n=1 Tax=Nocardioides sp. LML1-1-1.1 TaxID=3135248 RepID=UPI003426D5E2